MPATSLWPALATYRVLPLTATALGLAPWGALAYGASEMVRATWFVPLSITEMESLSELATYSSCRAVLSASELGWVPTVSFWRTRPVVASASETLCSPQLLTYTVLPSSDSSTPYGLWPTGCVALTVRPDRSINDNESSRLLATKSVLPSAAIANPAGYGLIFLPSRSAGSMIGSPSTSCWPSTV